MSIPTSKEISNLVATLQVIEQALTGPIGGDAVSEQTISELKTGIANLKLLAEVESIEFGDAQSAEVKGRFISRAEAQPLRKEFKEWAGDIFRSAALKNLPNLYISTSLVSQLLQRTKVEEDFLEISMGKTGKTIRLMMAVVDKNGKRLDDPRKAEGGGQDLLDEFGPCPQPPCPKDLD